MTADRAQIGQGAIVWAIVKDPRGRAKRRPIVILTSSDEILLDAEIVGVAVTSTLSDPSPPEYVLLPWSDRGHPATGLRRRSAAVCNWLVRLHPSDIDETMGFVPTKTLLAIVEKVRMLNQEPPVR